MSISSKVFKAPFSIFPPSAVAVIKVANSFSSNFGTVTIGIGALGTAGSFFPSLYFCIIVRSS